MPQPQRIEIVAGSALALGCPDLLKRKPVTLICSKKCSGDLILRAYDFAKQVRDAERPIASGFHAPIERDCLPILLRGTVPIIMCPARSIAKMRLRPQWKKAIQEGRLLILSPFDEKQKRATAALAEQRNRFLISISDEVLVAYASPGGKTEVLCREVIASGKPLYAFDDPANAHLIALGAVPISPGHFVEKHSGASA